MYSPQSALLGHGSAGASSLLASFQKRNPKVPTALGQIIVRQCSLAGVNSDLVAAQIAKETGWWTSYAATHLNNPAGVGITNNLPQEEWPGFDTLEEGVHAQVAHLLTYIEGDANPWKTDDPRFQVTKEESDMFGKAKVVQDLEQHWAYTEPTKYAATPLNQRYAYTLAQIASTLQSEALGQTGASSVPNRPYHVAISYGHHNTDGGDAVEKGQTPLLGKAVAQACQALGMEVRIVQEEVGLNPALGLQGVAQKVVEWDKAGWPVDLYLETHTEAGPRGVFAIYPDTGNDVDQDAKRVGQDAAKRVAAALGMPLRGDGTMSERATGVGAQGYRLGIFLVTAAINDHCTRMIIEFGSHTDPTDLALVNGHVQQAGQAVAQAFAAEAKRLGFQVGTSASTPPASDPNSWTDPVTNVKIIGGMLRRWQQVEEALDRIRKGEIYLIVGHAVEPERELPDGSKEQKFEHQTWRWKKGQSPDRWDILVDIQNPFQGKGK